MKVIIVTIAIFAASYAEVPSNSYLPPPSKGPGFSQGSQGFAQGNQGFFQTQGFAPEVVAARSFGPQGNGQRGSQGHGGNGFGGSSQGRGQFRTSEPSGYDNNASSFGRNGGDEINAEPAYKFGYMVNDYQQGAAFGHSEQRQLERAQGQYHVVLPDGRKQTVNYEADERGFKPQISYQDSEDSGYDSNAQLRNNGYEVGNHGNGIHNNGYQGNGNNGYHSNGGHNNGFHGNGGPNGARSGY